jgi:hypothetical protein
MTFHPYVYLDRALLIEKGLDIAEVSTVVAQALIEFDGIGYAIPLREVISR